MRHIPGDTLEINRKERAQTPSLEVKNRLPTLRICDFEEVRIPFTPEQAMYEASRCIECPDPGCLRACLPGEQRHPFGYVADLAGRVP